uniref:Uncharacterized protein n=1 Tax=Anguilla anguilla TaxID=7936 RepID=A0A0E9P5F8_ANGAN
MSADQAGCLDLVMSLKTGGSSGCLVERRAECFFFYFFIFMFM